MDDKKMGRIPVPKEHLFVINSLYFSFEPHSCQPGCALSLAIQIVVTVHIDGNLTHCDGEK